MLTCHARLRSRLVKYSIGLWRQVTDFRWALAVLIQVLRDRTVPGKKVKTKRSAISPGSLLVMVAIIRDDELGFCNTNLSGFLRNCNHLISTLIVPVYGNNA